MTIKSKWYPLLIICLTQILSVSDNAIMFNALSVMIVTFKSSVTAIQLANSMYPLIAGALMLAGGFLGLKIGWKKLLYIGLILMVAGEIIAWIVLMFLLLHG
jgi:MFS family permease